MTYPAHLQLGKTGENVAASMLANKGYVILARNWHIGHLELDIVCERDGEISFMEIKTRTNNSFGGGPGAITLQKRKSLIKAAQLWLSIYNRWHSPCHFDLICLYVNGENFRMEHYRDAIEFSPSLGGGDANWQPW